MKKLIDGWRASWKNEAPFYYVQIAPYHYKGGNYQGALLREQQTKALEIPKTGMVVTTDLVTDTMNIHPTNKQDVGLRLANLALSGTYGKKEIYSKSPLYKDMVIDGKKAKLTFDYIDKGFTVKGKEIKGFQIAGQDRQFHPAQATIKGNSIEVSGKEVKLPAAVRFGFSNASETNLFSSEGLPVVPFRTDTWEN